MNWLVEVSAGTQGAEDDISRSWPTSRRVSCEGGAEDVLARNEKRYCLQWSYSKRTKVVDSHEHPVIEDNTFHLR